MFSNPKHDFVSPLRSVGLVVSNGKVSQDMVNSAFTNTTPYYPLSDTAARDFVGIVGRGQIVFQSNDSRVNGCLAMSSTDPGYMERENSTMKGMTILNGSGDNALDNYDFLNTIQVLGIVEMGNEMNCRDRFNILSGGITDVKNESNTTINNGDWLLAYPPRRDEISKGGGKCRTNDEKNGVVHLWYKKYEPELHRFQLKQIYTCLLDTQNTKNYLPAYRDNCRQMIDSVSGMFMTMFYKNLSEIRRVLAGPDATRIKCEADLLAFILAKTGHSEFRSHPDYKQSDVNEMIDALFVPFSTNSRNATEYIFTEDDEGATKRQKALMKHLNGIQTKSTGAYLESVAYFVNLLKRQLVGQARSTARPGDDFSLLISLG